MLEKYKSFIDKHIKVVSVFIVLFLIALFFIPVLYEYYDQSFAQYVGRSGGHVNIFIIFKNYFFSEYHIPLFDFSQVNVPLSITFPVLFYFALILMSIVNLILVLFNKKAILILILIFTAFYIGYILSIFFIYGNVAYKAEIYVPHIGFFLLLGLCVLTGLYYAATHPIRRAKAYIGNVREKLAAKCAKREASHPLTDKERIEQLEQQVKELSEKVKK